MIISITGRKGSGKTTLANELIKVGFEKISFADKLKDLVCELYGWDRQKISDINYKEEILKEGAFYGEEESKKLAELIGDPSLPHTGNRVFLSRRQALQYIGTEVLRKHKPNFHVESLVEKIVPNKNYVIDDSRFKDEKAKLDSLGAISLFIIRPNNLDYSNHESEIDLNRRDFNFVLVNKTEGREGLGKFVFDFLSWFKLIPRNHPTEFDCRNLSEKEAYIAGFLFSGEIDVTNTCVNIFEAKNKEKALFLTKEISKNKIREEKYLKHVYFGVNINSDLVEEFKELDVYKGGEQTIPKCILNDEKLFEMWIMGLVSAAKNGEDLIIDVELPISNNVCNYLDSKNYKYDLIDIRNDEYRLHITDENFREKYLEESFYEKFRQNHSS